MAADIDRRVANCPVCLQHSDAQRKELLSPHPVPEMAWQKVGADVFSYRGKKYLLLIEYYSMYPEVIETEDKTGMTVIVKMKETFAGHGIPEHLITDNLPFDSQEFRRFTRNWGIQRTTSKSRVCTIKWANEEVLCRSSKGC